MGWQDYWGFIKNHTTWLHWLVLLFYLKTLSLVKASLEYLATRKRPHSAIQREWLCMRHTPASGGPWGLGISITSNQVEIDSQWRDWQTNEQEWITRQPGDEGRCSQTRTEMNENTTRGHLRARRTTVLLQAPFKPTDTQHQHNTPSSRETRFGTYSPFKWGVDGIRRVSFLPVVARLCSFKMFLNWENQSSQGPTECSEG